MPRALQESLLSELNEIASQNVGESHTFTLIEHLRDNFETYAQQIRDAKKRPKERAIESVVSEDMEVTPRICFLTPFSGKER